MADDDYETDPWAVIPDDAPVKFDSAEHADIPSQCQLKFDKDGKTVLNGNDLKATLWPLDFNLEKYKTGDESEERIPLTFAKIIAYAGDFYTYQPLNRPISYGKTADERQRRLRWGVKSLLYDSPGTLPALDGEYMTPEVGMINKIMTESIDPRMTDEELQKTGVHAIMQNYKNETNGYMPIIKQFGMIGQTRYGDILQYNMDHFGEYAWSAYRAGHAEALRIARGGIDVQDHGDLTDLIDWWDKPIRDAKGNAINLFKVKDGKSVVASKADCLKLAYIYDAFALHYLSDQFSSGHTRSPRMEMNKPTALIKALSINNKILGFFKFDKLKPCRGGWDGMTGFLHDIDGATGMRVSNAKGDSWIAYGDAQYFNEPNRINRLKSIECCQKSLTEVYDTWKQGDYLPSYLEDGKFNPETNKFAALDLVPLPGKPILEQQTEDDGNPSILWVVSRDTTQPTAQETAEKDLSKDEKAALEASAQQIADIGKDAAAQAEKAAVEAAKKPVTPSKEGDVIPPPTKAPIGTGIEGEKLKSENGFFFARRVDVENCSVMKYKWGTPGLGFLWVSSDVAEIERSGFTNDKQPDQARSLEPLSGGFIQVQEYDVDGRVNYAVNVWGPVQVPIEYKPYPTNPKDKPKQALAKASSEPERYVPPDRQMTFTWRGRRKKLRQVPETVADNKVLRWHSWFDPVNKKKTSLLKFSFSETNPANSIVVESWAFNDQSAKTKPKQQWANYEELSPKNRLEFGGPDMDSINDIKPFALLPSSFSFTVTDWMNVAHATRFFITPFTKGSTSSNPDIITFTWRCKDNQDPKKGADPVISVASTDNLLLNPKVKIPPVVHPLTPITLKNSSPFRGFVKRFEDEDNKSMILFARATNEEPSVKDGIQVIPQVFYYDGSSDTINTSSGQLPMSTYSPPRRSDFYQVLVGDTRLCGNKEMVVLAQYTSPTGIYYYLRSWKLDSSKKWISTSGGSDGTELKNRPHLNRELLFTRDPTNLLCCLMPNEEKRNGLNVVLVQSYEKNNTMINFRTFVKDGEPVLDKEEEEEVHTTSAPPVTNSKPSSQINVPSPATASSPAKSGTSASWVMVSWDGNSSTLVPSWVFDPSAKQPTGLPDLYLEITEGENNFSEYDPYKAIIEAKGDSDLAYLASQPVPSVGSRPIRMGVITGPGLKPGCTVPMPTPYKAPANPPNSQGAPSTFIASSPLGTYGRYQAIPCDVGSLQPCAVLKLNANIDNPDPAAYTLYHPNGGKTAESSPEDPWHYGDDVIEKNWVNDGTVEVEYFFDTVTETPRAVMFKRTGNKRYRILNPWILFQLSTQTVVRSRSLQMPKTTVSPPTLYSEINKISTAYEKPKKRNRNPAGWKDFIDCAVEDPLAKNPHFHMLGWRMCKVASTIRGVPMWGIMNIFSFHGIIGCRVWAPREPGEYHRWISRGMNPYMGQTSLGTGYNSTGKWNDNVASLSWGPTEDFADMNVWNEKTASWSEVPSLNKVKYSRGFQAKEPYDHKVIYIEAADIYNNIPVVSPLVGLAGRGASAVAGGIGSIAGGLASGVSGILSGGKKT